jgi:hypothetical protein
VVLCTEFIFGYACVQATRFLDKRGEEIIPKLAAMPSFGYIQDSNTLHVITFIFGDLKLSSDRKEGVQSVKYTISAMDA